MSAEAPVHFWVNGIIAVRDKMPYIVLSNENGMVAQLSMSEARQVAQDILVMTSRTEADAMIFKFFDHSALPPEAGAQLMQMFREFRAQLDDEQVKHDHRGGFAS